MNTLTCQPNRGCAVLTHCDTTTDPNMLVEVDFKWLMAGQGCWVDSARMRADPLYATLCLNDANNSPCDALRACAQQMEASLITPPFAASAAD